MRRTSPQQYATALAELAAELPASELPKLARAFVERLTSRRELSLTPRVVAALERLSLEAGESVDATITTARPLTGVAALAARLAKAVRVSHVELTSHQDPSLVGGAVIRVGDLQVDGSVHGLLSALTR